MIQTGTFGWQEGKEGGTPQGHQAHRQCNHRLLGRLCGLGSG